MSLRWPLSARTARGWSTSRARRSLTRRGGAALATIALAASVAGIAAPAGARLADRDAGLRTGSAADCLTPTGVPAGRLHDRTRLGPDHRPVSLAEQLRIARQAARRLAERAGNRAPAYTVRVWVHVMRDSRGRGNVTDAQIRDQIDVLNDNFGGAESPDAAATPFVFKLVGIDRFKNDKWHHDGETVKYRSLTRKGGVKTLNLWVVQNPAFLGVATFPWDFAEHPKVDGIRVEAESFPGGSIENYNLGKTATHEAGHWLGLWHTFQGGCSAVNDEVEDTPAQRFPTFGCPEGQDSCPGKPGVDPIHNYMDYSYDSCYDQFTEGQSTRMDDLWLAYRTSPA